jgi:uncharacterized membrane protein SpoIIM required for sporulation
MSQKAPNKFQDEADNKPQNQLSEFLQFLVNNKKWWITPIALLLIVLGVLVMLGGSGVAPFIYSLF